MSVVDEYLNTLQGPERSVVTHVYQLGRKLIPEVTEQLSYNMPTLMYRDKGVFAVIVNANFISFYPFCNLERLGMDLAGYEATKGSIHFSVESPLSDKLITALIQARLEQIIEYGKGTY